ncbi:hypothetical protein [Virgibacillus ainsalahensis]
MKEKKMFAVVIIVLLSLIVSACARGSSSEETEDLTTQYELERETTEDDKQEDNDASEEKESIRQLDEKDEAIEEVSSAEEIAIKGGYAEVFTDLQMPFDEDKWTLGNYQEDEGEAIAEFLTDGETFENYSQLLTIHYFQEGMDDIGIANFMHSMETNLSEETTGELEFNRIEETEHEGMYEFSLSEDDVQFDQEELGNVFVKDNDLLVVRYTTMEKDIKDRDEWLEKLSSIQ